MNELVKVVSYNQTFVLRVLSSHAPGLYTYIKLYTFLMSSSLKSLEQFSPDFICGLLSKGF